VFHPFGWFGDPRQMGAQASWQRAGAAHHQDDATPYLEREAMEAFTVGLTLLLDGIEAAMARDRRAR
jgi:hypothetical protein